MPPWSRNRRRARRCRRGPSCEAIRMIEPPPLGDHQRQCGAAQQKRAGQIDRHHPLPIGDAGLGHRAAGVMRSRAADHDVEPAERVPGCRRRRERVAFDRDVAASGEGAAARLVDQPRRFLAPARSMSQHATAAPASAKAVAIARPMPPAAPLTSAAFPVSVMRSPRSSPPRHTAAIAMVRRRLRRRIPLHGREPADQITCSVRGSIRCI